MAWPPERVVPDGGAGFCGVFIPGGTVVVHFDDSVFGEGVEQLRPRRWLDAGPVELKRMERCFFAVSNLLLRPIQSVPAKTD